MKIRDPRSDEGSIQSTGAFVSVGDTQRLWVQTQGRGRPLVLLADIGFDRRVWQTVADRMAADVAVTAVDPRGWGRSEASTHAESLADDVVGLLAAPASSEPVVLGAQGEVGQAALLAAARAPERVAGVLAIQPAVRGAEPLADFDVVAAGAVADEHFGGVIDAIVAARSGKASRDAVLAALIDAVLPASLEGRPEGDLVTTILRDNLDGYLDLRGPGSSRDDGDAPQVQLQNVRCPVVVAIPRSASPVQRWAQGLVLDSVPDAVPRRSRWTTDASWRSRRSSTPTGSRR
jgi:pimeloyl-ACP methyl ester carboxylesterase